MRSRWIIVGAAAVLLLLMIGWMTAMPGSSAREPLPEPTAAEWELAVQLERDVRALAVGIGERNLHTPGSLERSADWIASRLHEFGYAVQRHRYTLQGRADPRYAGVEAENLVVELAGSRYPEEIVVIGAHYDTVPGSPGANDNASGVAVLLALAEDFADRGPARTLRFVFFTNEEQPFFQTADMGSYAYARQSRQRGESVVAMLALDGLGYFDTRPGSQTYPLPGLARIYPEAAYFIGFITRARDAALLREAIGAFRERASIPSAGAALPALADVGRSDHWSFWQAGYPAVLVTDTLPFRDPAYHTPQDTPERLDYLRMARVAAALSGVAAVLATP